MTYEAYYGDAYPALVATEKALRIKAERIKNECGDEDDVQPVVYYCSRIKKPESMMRKLAGRALATDAQTALCELYDAVGVRIICSFASDVFNVVARLERESEIEVVEKKDYLTFPKPNGYRSIHLLIRLKTTEMPAEIQVRTLAMDCWATLEHQVKYKKNVKCEALIRRELKRCADEIASADLSMQTIRDILKEM